MNSARVLLAVAAASFAASCSLAQPSGDARKDLRQQFAAWLQHATRASTDNRNVQTIAMASDAFLAAGQDVWLLLGGSYTPATREYFVLTWVGELHVFELHGSQARAAGLAPSKALFGETSGGTLFSRLETPPYALEHLQIDNRDGLTGDREISGTVVCRSVGGQSKPKVALRVSVRTEHGTFGSAIPVNPLSADGVLRFEIEPINALAKATSFGPTPVFVELVVNGELSQRVVVSNTLSTLVDVELDLDGYASSALAVMEQMVRLLERIRDQPGARKGVDEFTRCSVQNQFLAEAADRLGPFTPQQDADFERKYGARFDALTQQLAAQVTRLEQADYAGSAFFDDVQRSVQAAPR